MKCDWKEDPTYIGVPKNAIAMFPEGLHMMCTICHKKAVLTVPETGNQLKCGRVLDKETFSQLGFSRVGRSAKF